MTTMLRVSPLVSVVIPTHNRHALLSVALASVERQRFRDFEVIVVDDGSTDGTSDIIRERNPDVRLIQQARSRRGRARNRGIAEARGRFIAFLDDDDLFEPTHLSQFASYVSRQGGHAFAAGARFWDPNAGRSRINKVSMRKWRDTSRACLIGTIFPLPSLIVERSLILEIGGFPEGLTVDGSEDFVFLARLASRTPIERLPEVSLRIRQHERRGMYDFEYIIRSRFSAMDLLLDEGVGGRPLDDEEKKLVVAGTHRLAAALYYDAGDLQAARRELSMVHQVLGHRHAVALTARLWLGSFMGKRLSSATRALIHPFRWRRSTSRHHDREIV